MPIPGLTDMYQFVDWIKTQKYHLDENAKIVIRGEKGGLVTVMIQAAWVKPGGEGE